ncbi:3-beta hydroxysteroid dehydrogenase/isomerase family-domain-containing protein [Amylostereum chailletii]|nr:3-beta hydroxysteroid dehydrogenase/isomerase family-domain-containing protein [Amylostereum chailletii]
MDPFTFFVSLALPFFVLYLYFRINDAKLMNLPADVAKGFSPRRITPKSAREAETAFLNNPISIEGRLPPKTGRRYIVIGGAGFLGGWIIRHLLERGEDPRRIRVLDIRPPTRPDLTTGIARDINFLNVDISDKAAVDAAFHSPWPPSNGPPDTTVFHTAATIRFYERHPDLVHLSSKVNVQGTQNVVDAARSIGASALVYTSSGSVLVRRTRFWLWPWEKQPARFTQTFTDDDSIIPARGDDMFSNYAVTKIQAERLIRAADASPSGSTVLRTGCIRPGNGIFGPGGDILCGAYLVRQVNPTWISNILQNFVYVENASLAHLCYERCLLDTLSGSSNPDLGGQAFCVTDAGPPITYGDVYLTLNTLTDGLTTFPEMSATSMLFLATVFEKVYLARTFMRASTSAIVRRLGALVPALNGDLVNLQPSLFALTQVHLIFDDSRARLPLEKGGLGYSPPWTTLDGLCKLVDEHKKAGGKGEERSMAGGVSFGFISSKAGRGVGRVIENMGVDPSMARN